MIRKITMKYIRKSLGVCLLIIGIFVFAMDSMAQDQIPLPQVQPPAMDGMAAQDSDLAPPEGLVENNAVEAAPDGRDEVISLAESKRDIRDASITPEMLKTLFFTAWQYALLEEAKIGFNTRLPNPGEVGQDDNNRPVAPGIRELTLGGIAFAAPKKWTVWLNNVRVTPDAIPEQVLDIQVTRSYVNLKWYDPYTKKIFPIRMRPHERFNLDTRIFLPGTGTM